MYSLIALFFSLPLYFSHIFASFGLIIGESSSFERQKVYLFGILICLSLLDGIFSRTDHCIESGKKYWKYLLAFLLLPLGVGAFWTGNIDEHFFLGSFEKHHGYLWYSACIALIFLLMTLTNHQKKQLVHTSIYSGFCVAVFAILEYISGGSLFFPRMNEVPWGEARSISTLGNPNYVAGYLIMLLPFLSIIRSPERYVVGSIFVLAIFSTGSYIGIALMLAFFVYILARKFLQRGQAIVFTLCVGVGSIIGAYSLISHDKFLSLESRFVLMKDLGTFMVQYPINFIFGYGPESIITYFSGTRSALVDAYFPSSSAIDSSHNIFLDVIFQYGILLFSLLSYSIYKISKLLTVEGYTACVLGLLFLSLNVTVTLHIIMLCLLFSLRSKESL